MRLRLCTSKLLTAPTSYKAGHCNGKQTESDIRFMPAHEQAA